MHFDQSYFALRNHRLVHGHPHTQAIATPRDCQAARCHKVPEPHGQVYHVRATRHYQYREKNLQTAPKPGLTATGA